MFLSLLLFSLALSAEGPKSISPSPLVAVNQPGAAGVPTWFSTLTYFKHGDSDNIAQIYVSGVIGTPYPSKPGPPTLVPGGIANQTAQALTNIVSAIQFGFTKAFPNAPPSDNLDFRRAIAKCRVYQGHISSSDANLFEKTYADFFDGIAPPARVAFQGAQLVIDAAVELECDAVVQEQYA